MRSKYRKPWKCIPSGRTLRLFATVSNKNRTVQGSQAAVEKAVCGPAGVREDAGFTVRLLMILLEEKLLEMGFKRRQRQQRLPRGRFLRSVSRQAT